MVMELRLVQANFAVSGETNAPFRIDISETAMHMCKMHAHASTLLRLFCDLAMLTMATIGHEVTRWHLSPSIPLFLSSTLSLYRFVSLPLSRSLHVHIYISPAWALSSLPLRIIFVNLLRRCEALAKHYLLGQAPRDYFNAFIPQVYINGKFFFMRDVNLKASNNNKYMCAAENQLRNSIFEFRAQPMIRLSLALL